MTKDPICVSEESGFNEIVKILVNKHLIRVPVVRSGKLVGVVCKMRRYFCIYSSYTETS